MYVTEKCLRAVFFTFFVIFLKNATTIRTEGLRKGGGNKEPRWHVLHFKT